MRQKTGKMSCVWDGIIRNIIKDAPLMDWWVYEGRKRRKKRKK